MRRIFTKLGLALLTVAVFLTASNVMAQEKSDRQLAQEHFNAGAKAYLAQDYSEAVVQFLTAFEYEENAMILYNLSLAYQGLGDLEKSRSVAERAARREDLPDKARPRNDARIVALQVAISAEGAASSSRASVRAEGEGAASGGDPVVEESSETDGDETIGTMGWIGTATMGVGAGVLVYALIYERSLAKEIEEFERNPTEQQRQSLAGDQQTGQIILYAGSGLVAAGAILFLVDFMDGSDDSEPSVTATVMPTRGGAAFGLGGAF